MTIKEWAWSRRLDRCAIIKTDTFTSPFTDTEDAKCLHRESNVHVDVFTGTFLVTMKDTIPSLSTIFFFNAVLNLKLTVESNSKVIWHLLNIPMP